MDDAQHRTARRIRDVIEPLAANVYFAPEVHAAFVELGFGPGRAGRSGLMSPNLDAYFTSRGACMGTVTGEVVVAAFGVFDPGLVIPAVTRGWKVADRDAVLAARERGAVAGLVAILGESPAGMERATELLTRMAEAGPAEGRHLFSGLRSLGFPGTPMGDLWRAADLVREHRGDSHIAAWSSHGLDGLEICLLSDGWLGAALKTGSRTRGWSDEQLDAGLERLRSRGLVAGDTLSDEGLALREAVEATTDVQELRMLQALGDDAAELIGILEPWAAAIVEAKGYPYLPNRP